MKDLRIKDYKGFIYINSKDFYNKLDIDNITYNQWINKIMNNNSISIIDFKFNKDRDIYLSLSYARFYCIFTNRDNDLSLELANLEIKQSINLGIMTQEQYENKYRHSEDDTPIEVDLEEF